MQKLCGRWRQWKRLRPKGIYHFACSMAWIPCYHPLFPCVQSQRIGFSPTVLASFRPILKNKTQQVCCLFRHVRIFTSNSRNVFQFLLTIYRTSCIGVIKSLGFRLGHIQHDLWIVND
jgi:hypothetical protein